jgi:glycolate oxidase
VRAVAPPDRSSAPSALRADSFKGAGDFGPRVERAAVAALKAALVAQLPEGGLRDDPATLAAFGHDESNTLFAFPETTAQVQAIVRACMAHGVPVTPVGARSGKSGGSLPVRGGLSLCLEKLDHILLVDDQNLIAVAQAGVVLGALHAAVEAKGLFYAPDPNSLDWCTLGGNVAENAGGPRALKYGVTRDHVIGLEWVLPSGEAIRLGRRVHKGVTGYDLLGLFVGSEGTLGVATEVTVKLLPLPKVVLTALVLFQQVEQAAQASTRLLQSQLLPRCLELLDDVALAAVKGAGLQLPQASQAVLLIELDGPTEDSVLAEAQTLEAVCRAEGALEVRVARDETQRAGLWAVRKSVSGALKLFEGRKVSEDVVVPRARLGEAIARFKALGAAARLTVATYGHAGDGNLHTNVLYSKAEQKPEVDALVAAIAREAVALGGTLTGEHGIGVAKRHLLTLEQGPGLIAVQKSVKAALDPLGLFNPGKIFP